MIQLFKFESADKSEINDVQNPRIFPLEGYTYEITIRPKCKFWRIGLRFNIEMRSPGYSPTSRYNNNQIRHVEVCAGIRAGNSWQKPNQLELQQYHFFNDPGTLVSFETYQEQSVVKLKLKANSVSKQIELQLDPGSLELKQVELGFYKSFQIWGWADFSDFEIDTEVKSSLIDLPIDLVNIKALSFLQSPMPFVLRKLNIFFGRNNSGKSTVLLAACQSRGSIFYSSIDYIGLNRFHTNSEYDIKLEGLKEHEKDTQQRQNQRKRTDVKGYQNEYFDSMHELLIQEEDTRTKILTWMGQHFEPWEFHEIRTGRFVTGINPRVNNVHPADQGNGARAVLPIIIQLFNPNLDVLAIDEPELGLEPTMQKIIFGAIKDATEGINGFPLKRILIATHSHLFLDRTDIANNFSVEKNNGLISIKQLNELQELQEATYGLLGCSPSDLFFPSNVVIVEGKSDEIFLKAVYKAGRKLGYFKSENLVFHFLDGYDKLSHAPEAIVQMLKTQAYSPVYKDRICGIFDHPKKKSNLIEKIRKYFNDTSSERFILLDKPAIEYYYPVSVVNNIFKTNLSALQLIEEVDKFLASATKENNLKGQLVSHSLTKIELATQVGNALTEEDLSQLPDVVLTLLKMADKLAFK
jgi:predicted ATPase